MNAKINKLQQAAKVFGCTVEQVRAQYIKNIQGMELMYQKALTTGRKVNQYTAEELKQNIDRFKAIVDDKI